MVDQAQRVGCDRGFYDVGGVSGPVYDRSGKSSSANEKRSNVINSYNCKQLNV